MERAKINKIIKFSNVDGPGNRMSIFFQGCNFNCSYCHNPETINICNNCKSCIEVCPTKALTLDSEKVAYDKKKCIDCDLCIKACKNDSSPKIVEYSVLELVEEIKKIKGFIRGITVSGGEATLNYKFIAKLFKEVKKLQLTTFIDTNGYLDLSEDKYKELIKFTDKFMLDIKVWDEESHLKLTQKRNNTVKKNIDFLGKLEKLFEVRTVVVPNILENLETIEETSKIIGKLSKELKEEISYKIIRYRKIGVRKSYLENELLNIETPKEDELQSLKDIVKRNNVEKVIII